MTIFSFMLFLPLISSIILNLQMFSILMILLSLEALMLSMLTSIMFSMFLSSMENFYVVIFILSTLVCEASLGLSMLVSMSRCFGSDMTTSMMINKC